MTKIQVDCETCLARGPACGDCVITVLLGPVAGLELEAVEEDALTQLSEAGLVPPLRLVPPQQSDCSAVRSVEDKLKIV